MTKYMNIGHILKCFRPVTKIKSKRKSSKSGKVKKKKKTMVGPVRANKQLFFGLMIMMMTTTTTTITIFIIILKQNVII